MPGMRSELIALMTGPDRRVRPGLYAISATIRAGLKWRVYDPSPHLFSSTWNAQEHAFSYFQAMKPFARIGHSILLFRVSKEDAARLEAEPHEARSAVVFLLRGAMPGFKTILPARRGRTAFRQTASIRHLEAGVIDG